jgi:class 3 adenylate cyclase
MAEKRVERRLTAIFASDVVGYSRLMGADEEGTLARLNAHRREFLEPTIAAHRGRIVKRTGDGVLLEPLKFLSDSPPLIDEVQVHHADCVILARERTMMTLHCLLSTVFDPANHPSQR